MRLQKVEDELRTATQSLWDARTKDGADVALCNFLEPVQAKLADALELLIASREFLDGKEPN